MTSFKVFLSANPEQKISRDILQLPFIDGIRCNTGAPTTKSKVNTLKNFQTEIHPIIPWIDLKCRELRLNTASILPYDYLEINHIIEVDTPTELYYNEGKNFVIIDKVFDGNKLIIRLPENYTGKERIKFGKGASINIPDPSLRVKDYMTRNDIDYVKAGLEIGVHNYLLSYVEKVNDIEELLKLDPEANIIAKIESKNGIAFVKNDYDKVKNKIRLLAARADLYIELERPHEILKALKLIIKKDPNAIVGSRILESFMELEKVPRCTDFTDLGYLMEIGYMSFLLGDEICQEEETLSSALGVLEILQN